MADIVLDEAFLFALTGRSVIQTEPAATDAAPENGTCTFSSLEPLLLFIHNLSK